MEEREQINALRDALLNEYRSGKVLLQPPKNPQTIHDKAWAEAYAMRHTVRREAQRSAGGKRTVAGTILTFLIIGGIRAGLHSINQGTVSPTTAPYTYAYTPVYSILPSSTPFVSGPNVPSLATLNAGVATPIRPYPTAAPNIPAPAVPTAARIPTSAPQDSYATITWDDVTKFDNIPGSWVANATALRIRFFAPPSLVEDPAHTSGSHYALASPSNVFDFEALTIYRFAGNRGGEFASTFTREVEALSQNADFYLWSTTNGPRPQQVSGYAGHMGQFHYRQRGNDLPISGTVWVGQVGGDEVVIVYRCSPEREPDLDMEWAQVIRTIDFNAR